MKMVPWVFLFLAAVLPSAAQPLASTTPEQAIREVMNAQVKAWNRGDIEGFLTGYLKSPELLFASRGKFTHGWDTLLERYKSVYPEGQMGRLRFHGVAVHAMGDEAAWVTGSWQLEMEDSSPHGAFTLILVKTGTGWKIVHDHSSGVEPESDGPESQ